MWVVRLSDKQLEVMKALLRSEDRLGPTLSQGARVARARALGRAARRAAPVGRGQRPRRRRRGSPRRTSSGTWREQERASGGSSGSRSTRPAGRSPGCSDRLSTRRSPAPLFRPSLPALRHLHQPLRRGVVLGLALLVEALADRHARRRCRRSRAACSGPIGWPAPIDMQASTSAGVEVELVEQPDGVEEVGEEQAVDDEAGLVGDLDGALAERLAERAGRGRRRRRSSAVGQAELDQLHPRHRVEDVEAVEALGDPGARAELADRQRRGRRREVGVGAGLAERARAAPPWRRGPRRSPRRRGRSRRDRRGSVVTRTREASPPSTLPQSFSTSSSARHADASLRARTRTSPSAAAEAARPSGDRAAAGHAPGSGTRRSGPLKRGAPAMRRGRTSVRSRRPRSGSRGWPPDASRRGPG